MVTTAKDVKDAPFLCYQSAAQSEYTLCGDAFDLNELDDPEATTPRFAMTGELVTCPKCRKQVDDIRNGLTKEYIVKRAKKEKVRNAQSR